MSSASSPVNPADSPAVNASSSAKPSTIRDTPGSSSRTTRGHTEDDALEQELRAARNQLASQAQEIKLLRELVHRQTPTEEGRPSARSVTFDLEGEGSLRTSIEDPSRPDIHRNTERARSSPASNLGGPPDDGDDARRYYRGNSYRSPSGISTMSYATRIEKIPNLHDKLSDGIEYSPRLWKVQVQNSLSRYKSYFVDDDHRKDWLLAQTEGMARTFLEPSFLSTEVNEDGSPVDALDLIAQLVAFLTNPHEQQTARNNYTALTMGPRETFWEFYQQFRTLARKGGINDKSILKMDLQDKIPSRLRKQLFHEYRKARNLEDYVEAIQAEDQGQMVERTIYHKESESSAGKTISSSRRQASPRERSAPSHTSVPSHSAPQPWKANVSFSESPGWRSNQSPAPQNSARADTPRAQTPANAPRHFSSQPPANRPYTPRINEIGVDDGDDGSDSDSNTVEDNERNATLPVEKPTPRAKDQT